MFHYIGYFEIVHLSQQCFVTLLLYRFLCFNIFNIDEFMSREGGNNELFYEDMVPLAPQLNPHRGSGTFTHTRSRDEMQDEQHF